MIKPLEVYYDLTCPYCYRGLEELKELLKKHDDLAILWYPCEAHPRPEPAAVHSDLAAQAVLYLQEKGLDVSKFNTLVYQAHFDEKIRIDDPTVLAKYAAECGADMQDFTSTLSKNTYAAAVAANNQRTWTDLSFEAVPSYAYGDKTARSSGGRLVDIAKVEELLS